MPQLIKHIDQIAREKQRDVLLLEFMPKEEGFFSYEWETDPVRKKIIEDLTQMDISWMPCAHVANENCMMSYAGQIYIDVPFDKELPLYQQLEAYLEYPDGTMRFENVRFCILQLSTAMKNAHHDEPDFWEKSAED